jgi:hypothetical protein
MLPGRPYFAFLPRSPLFVFNPLPRYGTLNLGSPLCELQQQTSYRSLLSCCGDDEGYVLSSALQVSGGMKCHDNLDQKVKILFEARQRILDKSRVHCRSIGIPLPMSRVENMT